MIGQIFVLLFLVLLSGVFSSTEIAMFSLSEVKLIHFVEKKLRNSSLLKRLRDNSNELLIIILIGNNLVNIASASMATLIAIDLFGSKGVGIATGIMTLFILIFGEIIPKAYATKYAKSIALFMAPIIGFLLKIFYPLVWVFSKLTSSVVKEDIDEPLMTEEEVRGIVKISKQEGSIKQQEEEMIQNIFKLDDTYAEDIMTARPDVYALEADNRVEDVLEDVIKSGYSRIPIFDGDLDNILGLLYTKDLLSVQKSSLLKDIIRPVFFVPETKHIDSLLKDFKQKKMHLAIVVNEHGTTVGIVSIEDLIEEIVGEIYDETDTVEQTKSLIKKLSKSSFLVQGKAELDDVSKALGIVLDSDESSTLSGFVMERLNKLPLEGDSFNYKDFLFDIKKVESQRVEEVLIKKVS